MNATYLEYFLLLTIASLSIGCTALNSSVETQTTYLNEVLDAHNNANEKEHLAHKKYGYKSKAHIMAARKKAAINKENVVKIEHFLQRYGHPSKELHGSKLTDLPFIIFSTSSKSKKIILRNLTLINVAWERQTISDKTYIFYLQSLHQSLFKQKLKLEYPFTEKQELSSLWAKLNVDSLLNDYN